MTEDKLQYHDALGSCSLPPLYSPADYFAVFGSKMKLPGYGNI